MEPLQVKQGSSQRARVTHPPRLFASCQLPGVCTCHRAPSHQLQANDPHANKSKSLLQGALCCTNILPNLLEQFSF